MSKLKAKKSLGQNFLNDQEAKTKIINSAELSKKDTIIEIGPGKGILTKELLKKSKKVIAYELDERLKDELCKLAELELHMEDILEAKIPNIEFKLVANIPYYITSPIINKFLKERAFKNETLPKIIVLLVQKEVAQKICSSKSSVLSLNIKTFGTPEIISIVKKESFTPAPKVDSAILKISNIKNPNLDFKNYFKLLHQAFKMPRKTIWNNLKNYHPQIKKILEKAQIDLKERAENISKEKFQELTNILNHS